mgnify:FL=1|jgi:hypothetical protein
MSPPKKTKSPPQASKKKTAKRKSPAKASKKKATEPDSVQERKYSFLVEGGIDGTVGMKHTRERKHSFSTNKSPKKQERKHTYYTYGGLGAPTVKIWNPDELSNPIVIDEVNYDPKRHVKYDDDNKSIPQFPSRINYIERIEKSLWRWEPTTMDEACCIRSLLFGKEYWFFTIAASNPQTPLHPLENNYGLAKGLPEWKNFEDKILTAQIKLYRQLQIAIEKHELINISHDKERPAFAQTDFLKWFQGLHPALVPDQLISAKTSIEERARLLKKMRTDFHYWVNTGEYPSGVKSGTEPPLNPTTPYGRKQILRTAYISEAAEKIKETTSLTSKDLLADPDLKALIRDGCIIKDERPDEKILKKNWIPAARKAAGVIGRPGAPKKKK